MSRSSSVSWASSSSVVCKASRFNAVTSTMMSAIKSNTLAGRTLLVQHVKVPPPVGDQEDVFDQVLFCQNALDRIMCIAAMH